MLLTLIVLALMIRVPLLVNAKPNDDELEHLHAAWAVAQGQVPHRDFFQNHPALFYYLMAPVAALMGEDLRIIYVGRAFMLICLLLILLQLYWIARECFDALTGLLAVLLLSYLLLWLRPSYEFRPDILQSLLIIASLWKFMLAWKLDSRLELLVSGALLGIGFWVLSKTLFPFAGLSLVFVASIVLRRSPAAIRHNLTGLFLFLGAFAVPVMLGGFLLWMVGGLPGFLRWGVIHTFRYPVRFSAFNELRPLIHAVFFALAIEGVLRTVTRMVKARAVDEFQLSPLLMGSVTAAVFLFMMPAPNAQSALPFLPLAAMYGAEVLRTVIARAQMAEDAQPVASRKSGHPFVWSVPRPVWAGIAVLLMFGVCVPPLIALADQMSPFRDHGQERREKMRLVLALTSPDDSVFDEYALYIFRPHATYYYRLGAGVAVWLASRVIDEAEIINDLRTSHCKVAIFPRHRLGRLPPALLRFIYAHYVSTHFEPDILVAGKVLRPASLTANRTTVSLVASAEYAVQVVGGEPNVYIDGQLYRAPLFLTQGDHQILVEGGFQEVAIFYSRVLAVHSGDHILPVTGLSDPVAGPDHETS